jgi:hypothetical protein
MFHLFQLYVANVSSLILYVLKVDRVLHMLQCALVVGGQQPAALSGVAAREPPGS